MSEAAWVWTIVLSYLTVGSVAALIALGIRLRSALAVAIVLIASLLALVHVHHSGVAHVIPAAFGVLAVVGVTYLFVLRPRMGWREQKERREITRQVILHLTLVTGSLVFMFPFAWMFVTSLKEDEDMSKFPPVWIPRQQVKTPVDGEPRGLATASYQGQRVKVAVMQEFETGERRLRILEPANLSGTEFEAHRKQIEKIKTFAPVWKNYPEALKFLPPETKSGMVFLTNTLWLSAVTVLGTVLAGSLVAFSFARLRWPGRDVLFVVLLSTMMLPGAVTLMPNFLL
jgi:multiple sugar transport system permease protein